MATDNEVTLTATKVQDGALVIKEGDADVRYVPEKDLLAVKGSREAAEKKVAEAESKAQEALKAANDKAEETRQKLLQAETKITGLEAKIQSGDLSSEELKKAKEDLETAKKSSEGLGNKVLELRRKVIVSTYGVPVATVENKKTEAELDAYEEALKSVLTHLPGNYAVNAGGGGSVPQGSPMQLAVKAYSEKK